MQIAFDELRESMNESGEEKTWAFLQIDQGEMEKRKAIIRGK
jgi:hypothetical protein